MGLSPTLWTARLHSTVPYALATEVGMWRSPGNQIWIWSWGAQKQKAAEAESSAGGAWGCSVNSYSETPAAALIPTLKEPSFPQFI